MRQLVDLGCGVEILTTRMGSGVVSGLRKNVEIGDWSLGGVRF
jgi:hypothetical protein